MQTKDVQINLTIMHAGEEYDLHDFEFEAEYEVDGEDAPATWGYYGGSPAESAAWLVYHLRVSDQDQITVYDAEAAEHECPPLPWKEGDDLWELLTPEQQRTVEEAVEKEDRDYEPDYEPCDYYDEEPWH